jgi:Domain of unknown function (DUF4350)
MKPPDRERKLVLIFCAAVLLVIAAASLLAPPNDDSNKSPTTYNSGTAGIRAAYLLLDQLGYSTTRWEQPPSGLASIDAPNTTVIFAEPDVPLDQVKTVRADIAAFLNRGGHVLVTGADAAILLPDAATGQPTQPFGKLCVTEPEGRSPLARAGHVSIPDQTRWTAMTPAVHVQQWCGADAVVVSYQVGAGTVIWWSSAQPLTNLGLKSDASLKLLLASIDSPGTRDSTQPHPAVFFDEYFHGIKSSLSDYTHGLPLTQIAWQIAAVALLLVLSFGRRNGPIRLPLRLPRTSPIEFAESMGDLYRKAGATQAATEGARRRLLRFLVDRCGLPRAIAQSDVDTIAQTLNSRYPGDWASLAEHLTQAAEAQHVPLAPRSALALVKALDSDLKALAERTAQPHHP